MKVNMLRVDELVDNRILQNITIWMVLLCIFTMVIQSDNPLLTSLYLIAFIIPPVYISNLKVLPFFFKEQKVLAIFLFLANIFVFTGLGVLLLSSSFETFEFRMLYNVFGGVLLSVLFGATLKISRDSFFRRQQEKEAELKLLKAQLNPHFLFNTLNNLYGLSVVKSDRLPDLMLKLSDLLRYSLYETKETFVPLEKEIRYLENYMSLEKIRLEDQTNISFVREGSLEGLNIVPMLLIVFVENAFKHQGAVKDEKGAVKVSLKRSDGILDFNCTNTVDAITGNELNMERDKSGIGLQNAKKRLKLIYPGKHQLIVRNENDMFHIQLKLMV